MYHIWKCCVDFHCIDSMQWLQPNRINRACCTCFWASSHHWNRFISRLEAPCCKKQNMQAIGRQPPTKASSYCRVRIYQTTVRTGIQEAASPPGGQLSQKEVDEKEEHQPTSTTPLVLCTTCERQCITTLASLPWSYFPDNDQKNSGSISTAFYM